MASSPISQDEIEHSFDQIIRIGYGLPIISFLFAHEASALGCVNKQCAEAVRWQREKGNLVFVWSENDNHHVTLRYKDVNVTTNFPVFSVSLKTIKIDLKERNFRNWKYIQMVKDGRITLDHKNMIYIITLYGELVEEDDGDGYGFAHYTHQKEIVVNKADSKVYYDTYMYFKKMREIRRAKEEAEKKRLEAIRLEEEKKRLYLEKHTIRIPAQYMQKPNPWKKLPKVEAMKL
jgi:hypothetical protein